MTKHELMLKTANEIVWRAQQEGEILVADIVPLLRRLARQLERRTAKPKKRKVKK